MKHLLSILIALLLSAPVWAANEIRYDDPSLTGQTLYLVLTLGAGDAESGESWDGDSWEPYTTTRTTWDIAMTEVGTTGRFRGSLPTAALAINKSIEWEIFQDANDDATPDHLTDSLLAEGRGYWNGAQLGSDATAIMVVRSNTAQAGAASTITLDASASAVTDFYRNRLIVLTGGTGIGQVRLIRAYNGTTKVAGVFAPWATAPDSTTKFTILALGQ